MRISDWSSDVCSSGLIGERVLVGHALGQPQRVGSERGAIGIAPQPASARRGPAPRRMQHDDPLQPAGSVADDRSEEHTSELQSLMRISYAVLCLKKKSQMPSDVQIDIINSNMLDLAQNSNPH